jgi:hypothetical protein
MVARDEAAASHDSWGRKVMSDPTVTDPDGKGATLGSTEETTTPPTADPDGKGATVGSDGETTKPLPMGDPNGKGAT